MGFAALANLIGLFSNQDKIRCNNVPPLRPTAIKKPAVCEFSLRAQVILRKHFRIGFELIWVNRFSGDTDGHSMKRIVQELGEGRQPYVSPYNVARLYGAIDDKPRALEWLERAYEEHNPDLIELTREPSFASLRSDAKFRELAVRIGWSSVPAAGRV
jgi:hypothetical protein